MVEMFPSLWVKMQHRMAEARELGFAPLRFVSIGRNQEVRWTVCPFWIPYFSIGSSSLNIREGIKQSSLEDTPGVDQLLSFMGYIQFRCLNSFLCPLV